MNQKNKSLLQERLTGLFLRLNGYIQSGFIPHSKIWGNAGTDIDRIGVRFPNHTQLDTGIPSSSLLQIPPHGIDIVIAEVKNNSLRFNDTITNTVKGAEENWKQFLHWIGMFDTKEINGLIPELIDTAKKHGTKIANTFPHVSHTNTFGLITIRPILFSIETSKTENGQLWINGTEILNYIWTCFCPELRREECSTRYPFSLWGYEYTDIVEYLKERHRNGYNVGTLHEMYTALVK